jgi:VRR-NUC domain
VTGGELQDAIVEAAHLAGFRAAHFAPARTAKGWRTPARYDAQGFPDLVLAGPRVIFAEIKGDGDRLRPEQEAWLGALRMAGAEVYPWTAKDWREARVEKALFGLRVSA